jgi:hypothetical protein
LPTAFQNYAYQRARGTRSLADVSQQRADVAFWPTTSDVAVQANVGLQVKCGSGSRVLERLKMTQSGVGRDTV